MFKTQLKALLCGCALLCAAAAQAGDYPQHMVRLVAPMAAGGGTDSVARIFALKLSERVGQTVIVENRPGAGGQLGAEVVATAPADGYTLLFASSSVLTLPYLRKTRFDLMRDFVPVGEVGVGNFALVINPKLPFNTLAEFLAAVKSSPGKYTFGSAGTGSAGHLAGELLKSRAGLDMVHVPFKSSGEITQALMSGQIDCAIDVLTVQKAQIEAHTVRGLATTGPKRDPFLPDLPTIDETKLVPGGYEMTYWFAVFMPAKTPAPVVQRMQREFAAVMKEPDVLARIKGFSLNPSTLTPAQFEANIASESAVWQKVITDSHIEARD